MRNAYRWIVSLLLAATTGFVLGTYVESGAPDRAAPLVTSEPADQHQDSPAPGPAMRSSGPGSAVEVKPSASERVETPASESGHITAQVETKSATVDAPRKALFTAPANQSDSAAHGELEKLHSVYRASCQFDPGYSALVGNASFSLAGANWQGGLIGYDVIEPENGRTTMTGSPGVTGSSNGTAEVQMLKSNAGVSFSGIVANGDLIVTTIFSEKNSRGAFLAAMSIHGAATGHTASQFYGACDVD